MYLAAWLRSQNHENTVICRRGAPVESEARRLGLAVVNAPFLAPWDPLSAFIIRRQARAAEARGLIPILHAHTANAAAVASLAARAGGPTYVAHRRVDFRLSSRISARLKYGPAQAVIAVSGFVAHLLQKDGISHLKIRVVPDSVPLGAEEAGLVGEAALNPISSTEKRALRARLRPDARPEALWIANLAAMVPHKDQETLLRAFSQVHRERPDSTLFVLGEGPLRARLEKQAAACAPRGSIRFLGHLPNAMEWLKAMDLYAHSSWGEGMGSVLLEAMACGIPIAATTAGGIPEVVEDGRSALLSEPRDAGALARNILRLANTPAVRDSISAEGLKRLGNFSLAHCGEKTLQAYSLATGFSGAARASEEVRA